VYLVPNFEFIEALLICANDVYNSAIDLLAADTSALNFKLTPKTVCPAIINSPFS
jgi:hypothetical protein